MALQSSWAWFMMACLAVFIFLALVTYRLYLAQSFIILHKKGLRLRYGLSGVKTWRWTDLYGISSLAIQEHILHLPVRRLHQATLFPRHGKAVPLRIPIQDMAGLTLQIKNILFPLLLPELRTRYLSGEWLSFGSVCIQREAIRLTNGDSHTTPWNQIESVMVKDGHLFVKPRDRKTRKYSVAKIPNIELLFELIHQGEPS